MAARPPTEPLHWRDVSSQPNRAPNPASAGAESAHRLALLLALVVVGGFLIAPVWIVKFPPLLDYPNHLARTFILAHLNDPAFHFREFYAADWGLYPYLTTDVALIGLQKFFAVALAGRILLSLYVLALPLAAWFFVRQANPGNDQLALWSLLASYNVFFLWGFLNMQLSLALCLVVFGLWLRYVRRPGIALWCLLLIVVTVLYFTHLMGFGLAGLIVSAYALLARRHLRELLLSWLAFAPGIGLHLLSRLGTAKGWSFEFRPFAEKIDELSAFMEGFSSRLDQFTVLALAACFLAAWWRNREFRWNHPWPVLTAGLFGLYWIFPWSYGVGTDADIRLLPFVFLLLPVVAGIGRRARLLAFVASALFLARTANVAYNFVSEQPELAGLARSFAKTAANARVLPIVEAKEDVPQQRLYAHFWAYGVIERGWFSPYLFAEKGLQPFQIRLDVYSPDGFWDLVYNQPPDWAQVQEEYDYVWAYHVPRFSAALAAIGQLIYTDGDLEVFQLRKAETKKTPSERIESTSTSGTKPNATSARFPRDGTIADEP